MEIRDRGVYALPAFQRPGGEEYFRSGPVTELGPDCYNVDLDQ